MHIVANIQKGDSFASDSVTECYVGTVTHLRNERNAAVGDSKQSDPNAGNNVNDTLTTTTDTKAVVDNTAKKEEITIAPPTISKSNLAQCLRQDFKSMGSKSIFLKMRGVNVTSK